MVWLKCILDGTFCNNIARLALVDKQPFNNSAVSPLYECSVYYLFAPGELFSVPLEPTTVSYFTRTCELLLLLMLVGVFGFRTCQSSGSNFYGRVCSMNKNNSIVDVSTIGIDNLWNLGATKAWRVLMLWLLLLTHCYLAGLFWAYLLQLCCWVWAFCCCAVMCNH